jgi:predicted kinase
MTALVMTVAPPGAGKSAWVARHFPLGQRVSLDHLRWVVSGDQADQTATPRAVGIMHEILAERMSRKLLTVLDATNASHEIRHEAARHALRWLLPVVAVLLHTPLDVCLARQDGRERPGVRWPKGRAVPKAEVRRIHAQIEADLPTMHNGGVISVVAHIGHEIGDFRTGYMRRDLRPVLPWLAALPERRTGHEARSLTRA